MNKAFTKESDDEDEEPEKSESLPENLKNYVTPFGFSQLQNELNQLLQIERPKVVETVRWAAGNGDRSENGDYIYGKKRLREIDRRVRYLIKRLDHAEIVDPKKQVNLTKVFFGATVTYIENNITTTIKLVGIDEADLAKGKVSWISPIAKALLKSQVGDTVVFRSPTENKILKITAIKFEAADNNL